MTLRLWDAVTGRELQRLPLPASLTCVAAHPLLLRAACGDGSGGVYLIDFLAIEPTGVTVTARTP